MPWTSNLESVTLYTFDRLAGSSMFLMVTLYSSTSSTGSHVILAVPRPVCVAVTLAGGLITTDEHTRLRWHHSDTQRIVQRWKPRLKLKVIWKHNSENNFFWLLGAVVREKCQKVFALKPQEMCQLRNRINIYMAIQSFYFPGIHGQFVILGYVNKKDLTGTRLCLLYSIEVIIVWIHVGWTTKQIFGIFYLYGLKD